MTAAGSTPSGTGSGIPPPASHRYAQQQLSGIDGIRLTDTALHLREFEIDVSDAGQSAQGVVDALRRKGI